MAHESLKNSISSVIKTNGNQEITGAILQNILLSVVNNLGDGATFKGVATPSTYASTTFDNVFYIAVEKGSYPSFSSSIGASDGLVVFSYSGGSWLKTNINVATKSDLTTLAAKSELTPLATKTELSSGLATKQNTINDSNKLSFTLLKDKPTTISGYGITDAYTKTEVDDKDVPLQSQTDTLNTKNQFNELTTESLSAGTISAELIFTDTIIINNKKLVFNANGSITWVSA